MTTHANPCADVATWVVSVNTWHMRPDNDEWQRKRWRTFAKHHLNVPFAVTIHVVKQFLIVVELIVPFVGGVIAKVITEWHQQDVVLIQLGFLPILFQQHLRPAINNVSPRACSTQSSDMTADRVREQIRSVMNLEIDCKVVLLIFFLSYTFSVWYTFSALTLMVGWQEGHPACKNRVVGCWRSYLSGVRCRLAYGPADVTAAHCFLLQ